LKLKIGFTVKTSSQVEPYRNVLALARRQPITCQQGSQMIEDETAAELRRRRQQTELQRLIAYDPEVAQTKAFLGEATTNLVLTAAAAATVLVALIYPYVAWRVIAGAMTLINLVWIWLDYAKTREALRSLLSARLSQ
jgi:hypothetical protein